MATSPLPSQGPKRGQKCCVTLFGDPQRQARGAKSEVVPNKGEQNQKWLPHPCLLGGPKRGRKCYITPAFSAIPNAKRGEQKKKWLPHPCLLGGPKEGRNATSPLHSCGSPTPSVGSGESEHTTYNIHGCSNAAPQCCITPGRRPEGCQPYWGAELHAKLGVGGEGVAAVAAGRGAQLGPSFDTEIAAFNQYAPTLTWHTPHPLVQRTINPQKMRSEQDCSLDTPFGTQLIRYLNSVPN